MSLQNLSQIYTVTIIPVIDYRAEIWWQEQKKIIRSSGTLRNNVIRSILGVFKTTPIAALEAKATIPPTKLRLNQLK
jgi:hypothetical protein